MPRHTYYRVLAGLESRCASLTEANLLVERLRSTPMPPEVPKTVAPGEDAVTPRIPVCERVRDCFTAIGLIGLFRRCLGANDDCKSYAESGNEAYPVIVCEFKTDKPALEPSASDVPDVDVTHERWLTEPTTPTKVTLRWLDMYSIKIIDPDDDELRCDAVNFVGLNEKNRDRYNHPWLNGAGHVLDSSAMEDEPEPPPEGTRFLDASTPLGVLRITEKPVGDPNPGVTLTLYDRRAVSVMTGDVRFDERLKTLVIETFRNDGKDAFGATNIAVKRLLPLE